MKVEYHEYERGHIAMNKSKYSTSAYFSREFYYGISCLDTPHIVKRENKTWRNLRNYQYS